MLKDFSTAQKDYKTLTSDADRLKYALADIYAYHGISESLEWLPVFLGKVGKALRPDREGKDIEVYVIKDMYPLFENGNRCLKNPYIGTSIEINGGKKYFEKKVVVSVRPNNYDSPYKLLCLKGCFSFDEIGIRDDTDIDERANIIKDYKEFWPYKEQIENILQYRGTLREARSELQRIQRDIEEKEGERESIKQEIENIAPTGIDELKTELKELEEYKNQIAPEGIEATSKRLDKLKKELKKYGGEDVEGLEKKVHELTEKHSRLTDEMNALDAKIKELNAQKEELKQIESFVSLWSVHSKEWTCNPDNILHLADENSMDTLISRMEYDYSTNKNDILGFLMALNTTQLIALCGEPGTGKTTFVTQMSKALGAECHMIQVQNNWTEKGDILGYYNPINKTYQSTDFLDALIQARDEEEECKKKTGDIGNSRLHIICLDEMNLARIEYYYAFFLSLMQLDKKEIHLLPEDIRKKINRFREKYPEATPETEKNIDKDDRYLMDLIRYRSFELPKNVRIVGTMNVDYTTNYLSPKVIDRSYFIEMHESASDVFEEKHGDGKYYPASEFTKDKCTDWGGKELFSSENHRFKKYASFMCTIYREVKKFTGKMDLRELLILSKVLPSLTERLSEKEAGQLLKVIKGNSKLDNRYKAACDAGKKLDGDDKAFSFFGGV